MKLFLRKPKRKTINDIARGGGAIKADPTLTVVATVPMAMAVEEPRPLAVADFPFDKKKKDSKENKKTNKKKTKKKKKMKIKSPRKNKKLWELEAENEAKVQEEAVAHEDPKPEPITENASNDSKKKPDTDSAAIQKETKVEAVPFPESSVVLQPSNKAGTKKAKRKIPSDQRSKKSAATRKSTATRKSMKSFKKKGAPKPIDASAVAAILESKAAANNLASPMSANTITTRKADNRGKKKSQKNSISSGGGSFREMVPAAPVTAPEEAEADEVSSAFAELSVDNPPPPDRQDSVPSAQGSQQNQQPPMKSSGWGLLTKLVSGPAEDESKDDVVAPASVNLDIVVDDETIFSQEAKSSSGSGEGWGCFVSGLWNKGMKDIEVMVEKVTESTASLEKAAEASLQDIDMDMVRDRTLDDDYATDKPLDDATLGDETTLGESTLHPNDTHTTDDDRTYGTYESSVPGYSSSYSHSQYTMESTVVSDGTTTTDGSHTTESSTTYGTVSDSFGSATISSSEGPSYGSATLSQTDSEASPHISTSESGSRDVSEEERAVKSKKSPKFQGFKGFKKSAPKKQAKKPKSGNQSKRSPSPKIDIKGKPPRAPSPKVDMKDKPRRASSPKVDMKDKPSRASSPKVDVADKPPRAPSPKVDMKDKPRRTSSPKVDMKDKPSRASSPKVDVVDKPPRAPSPKVEATTPAAESKTAASASSQQDQAPAHSVLKRMRSNSPKIPMPSVMQRMRSNSPKIDPKMASSNGDDSQYKAALPSPAVRSNSPKIDILKAIAGPKTASVDDSQDKAAPTAPASATKKLRSNSPQIDTTTKTMKSHSPTIAIKSAARARSSTNSSNESARARSPTNGELSSPMNLKKIRNKFEKSGPSPAKSAKPVNQDSVGKTKISERFSAGKVSGATMGRRSIEKSIRSAPAICGKMSPVPEGIFDKMLNKVAARSSTPDVPADTPVARIVPHLPEEEEDTIATDAVMLKAEATIGTADKELPTKTKCTVVEDGDSNTSVELFVDEGREEESMMPVIMPVESERDDADAISVGAISVETNALMMQAQELLSK